MNLKYHFMLMLMLLFSIAQAQYTVKGKLVTQNDQKPIENAHIIDTETQNTVVSNTDGNFEIVVNSQNTQLQVTHINFVKTIKYAFEYNEKTTALQADVTQINDVIVVGEANPSIAQTQVIIDDIKKGSQVRNVADLFSDIPGFNLQKRSASAIEPSFRSFKYEEMNIKYDGGTKIVHACPNRMDPITSHIIPEEINTIEVVKGPYTVRYGQRFGAIVNLITKTPSAANYGWHGKVESGFETNGKNLLGLAELSYASKWFDVKVNGEARNFGDYKDGNGIVTPAGFETYSYAIKAGFNPGTKHRIVLDWRQKYGSNIKHAGLPMDSPKDNNYILSLDYKYDKVSKIINSISLKTYTSFVDHLMNNFDRPNFASMAAETPVKSRTLGGKVELSLAPVKNLTLFTGVDADLIDRTGQRSVTMKKDAMGNVIPMPMTRKFEVWQDAVLQDYGVFVEGNYKINANFSTTIGLRTDFVTASIRNQDASFAALYGGNIEDQFHVAFGANASAIYRKKGWQVELAYGRGTRTPDMIERYINKFVVGIDPYEYIGNPYLKPEINNQFELSFSKKLPKIHTGANAFYSIYENYITAVLNPDFAYMSMGTKKTPKQFINVSAEQFGLEAFFNYNFYKNLYFTSDIAYTSAYNKTLKEHLAQISPMMAHLGLKYENKLFWADWRTEFALAQNQIAYTFDETKTPGYIVNDFRIGVKPLKNLSIGGAVLNILDNDYYNHLNFSYKNAELNAGRVYEPGRSFSIFGKYTF